VPHTWDTSVTIEHHRVSASRHRSTLAQALADASTIAAVITSLGVGGLLGSLVKGWQEKSEKFRDRTIESCRDWLKAHDRARRELAAAHSHLLPIHLEASEEARASENRSLTESLAAWRELQTQTFLVSLLLVGGTNAPAAQAAQALAVCYDRWRDVLLEVRDGTLDEDAADKIIHFYVEHARAMYNEFVVEVNEAIRPSAPWRRAVRGDSTPFGVINDLDLFATRTRAHSTRR
jgi:hypothetical protein